MFRALRQAFTGAPSRVHDDDPIRPAFPSPDTPPAPRLVPGGRRPRKQRRLLGIAVPELVSAYGVYIVIVASAIAGVGAIYFTVRGNEMIRDLGLMVSAIQTMHTPLGNYDGITKDTVIDSGIVPDQILDDGLDQIILEGSSGTSYTLVIGEGVGAATHQSIGALSDRFFFIAIQGVDHVGDCTALMANRFPGLKGVQIQDANNVTTPIAAAAPPATGSAYQDPQAAANGRLLSARTAATLSAECNALTDDGDGSTILLGLR